MSEFWKGFLTVWVAAAIAVAFASALWKAGSWKPRKSPDVLRRVVKLEDCEGGKVATMECGHTVHWELVFPSECKCEVCTREVQALQKMAGVK